jgi:ABC-2 type transport system ATP-binding protein
MSPAIRIDNLTKRFGSLTAVKDLNLTVEEGEVFGFLGPNGAGKSTTINMLLDFIRPTSGRIEVLGMDAQNRSEEIRTRTGVLPEGFDVYDRLTGRKHVQLALDSKNARGDPMELLDRVDMAEAADRKAGGYSKGMQQRIVLAMALAGDPELLILDEPTTGLDPNGAREMRKIVREEASRGTTVFFSSHILQQVEAVCDRVGILRDGEFVAVDTIDNLRESMSDGDRLQVTTGGFPDSAVNSVRALDGVTDVRVDGNELSIETSDGSKTAVLSTLEEAGVTVEDFSTEEASLEDLFAAYTTDRQEVKA